MLPQDKHGHHSSKRLQRGPRSHNPKWASQDSNTAPGGSEPTHSSHVPGATGALNTPFHVSKGSLNC